MQDLLNALLMCTERHAVSYEHQCSHGYGTTDAGQCLSLVLHACIQLYA